MGGGSTIHEYAEARGSGVPSRPAHNGGLYTGAPFQRGGGWANVPIAPESDTFVQRGLTMGNTPPPGATSQLVRITVPAGSEPARGFVTDDRLGMRFPSSPDARGSRPGR